MEGVEFSFVGEDLGTVVGMGREGGGWGRLSRRRGGCLRIDIMEFLGINEIASGCGEIGVVERRLNGYHVMRCGQEESMNGWDTKKE